MENQQLLYYLIKGIKEWEQDFYQIPKKIQKGQQLLVFSCALNKQYPPTDLSSLIRMLMMPVEEWGVEGLTQEFPPDARIINRQFGLTEEADDFLSYYQHPEEADNSTVEQILQYCRMHQLQDEYVQIRSFLSNPKHSVIGAGILARFKRHLSNIELGNLLMACYEEVSYLSNYRKCPYCGWTLQKRDGAWRCNKDQTCRQLASFTSFTSFDTTNEKNYRMKSGVQKYTLLPGMAEKKIAKKLQKKEYHISMYPNIDEEDIAIELGHHTIYLDVKDYRNPYTLAQYLISKKPSNDCWYVIPSYHEEQFPAYEKIVQQSLEEAHLSYRIVMEHSLISALEAMQHA